MRDTACFLMGWDGGVHLVVGVGCVLLRVRGFQGRIGVQYSSVQYHDRIHAVE